MFDSDSHLLVASLLVLGLGPVLHQLARVKGTMLVALDGFVYVTIGGLVLLHIVPESYELAGWWTLVALLVGLVGPGLVEHRLRGMARQAHALSARERRVEEDCRTARLKSVPPVAKSAPG